MFFRVFGKEHIGELFEGLRADYDEVIGPRRHTASERAFVYDRLEQQDELCLDHTATIGSPKKYFLAPCESLLRFNRRNGEVFDADPQVTTRALLGLHPCDINALLLLDEIFLGDYVDPYYQAARANTFIVGTSCTPQPACVCNAFGTDEVHRGFDLFLTDLGDRYLVSCHSVPGAELLDRHVTTCEATPEDLADFQRRTRRFKESFTPAPASDQLPLLYDAKYEWPLFDEIGDDCLACGACSMVCPVCYCFDVKDEIGADGERGCRQREWDSCLFSEFAEVAHGHNFRATRGSRVRYRFYHKFVGNFERNGKMLCVGCGRCVSACKVNINPRRIIEALEAVGDGEPPTKTVGAVSALPAHPAQTRGQQ